MQPILYLSEAQHGTDKTACYICHSENGHSKALMNHVETAVKRQGWTYKRVPPDQHGNLSKRIAESNAMKANVHFVIHTNAGGGSNERILCNTGNAKTKAAAETFLAVRKPFWAGFSGVTAPAIKHNAALDEIIKTTAICLYDECLFHDNDANMDVYHGNMEANAENIVRALAAVFGVAYKPPVGVKAGDTVAVAGELTVTSVSGNVATLTAPVSACKPVGSTAPSKPVNHYPEPTADVKAGSKGDGVKWVQTILVRLGYKLGNNNPIDGSFGTMTVDAVKAFQKAHGLYVDGIVGPKTRAKLKEV